MKQDMRETIAIPTGVMVHLEKGIFTVKGTKGEIKRELHKPSVKATISGNEIVFESPNATQREKRTIMTFIAHLKSMFSGVQKGHSYKLKVCASHFPMTASVKNGVLEVKNFLGEAVARTMPIPQGVSLKVDGQFIIVEGIDKEKTSQLASRVELVTRRPGFDKRIFQDGIYLIEKDGKPLKTN